MRVEMKEAGIHLRRRLVTAQMYNYCAKTGRSAIRREKRILRARYRSIGSPKIPPCSPFIVARDDTLFVTVAGSRAVFAIAL